MTETVSKAHQAQVEKENVNDKSPHSRRRQGIHDRCRPAIIIGTVPYRRILLDVHKLARHIPATRAYGADIGIGNCCIDESPEYVVGRSQITTALGRERVGPTREDGAELVPDAPHRRVVVVVEIERTFPPRWIIFCCWRIYISLVGVLYAPRPADMNVSSEAHVVAFLPCI